MRASKGERCIFDILTEAEVDFQEEYSFPDLVGPSGRPLRFDFAVFDEDGDIDFLIEFQGEQHYKPKPKFGGLVGLRKQQMNDMKKRQYCAEHHIPLVIIPWLEINQINYNYIWTKAGY